MQQATIRNTLNNNKEKSRGGDVDLASDEGATKSAWENMGEAEDVLKSRG